MLRRPVQHGDSAPEVGVRQIGTAQHDTGLTLRWSPPPGITPSPLFALFELVYVLELCRSFTAEQIVQRVLPEGTQVVTSPATRNADANELMLLANYYERQVRSRQPGERRENVNGAERSLRSRSRFDAAGELHDAGAPCAAVERPIEATESWLAPGIDLDRDILAHMEFRPIVAEVEIMDKKFFR